jgi:hypothetical protein
VKLDQTQVQNGRAVSDEPMDLPDGTVLHVLLVNDGDALDDEERTELHAELRASLKEAKAGQRVDFDEVLDSGNSSDSLESRVLECHGSPRVDASVSRRRVTWRVRTRSRRIKSVASGGEKSPVREPGTKFLLSLNIDG